MYFMTCKIKVITYDKREVSDVVFKSYTMNCYATHVAKMKRIIVKTVKHPYTQLMLDQVKIPNEKRGCYFKGSTKCVNMIGCFTVDILDDNATECTPFCSQ